MEMEASKRLTSQGHKRVTKTHTHIGLPVIHAYDHYTVVSLVSIYSFR